VGNGNLQSGDELPSVREVADSLGINMHTVRNAYLKLRDQGIVNLRLGRRARIALRQPQMRTVNLEGELKERLNELITDALLSGYSLDDFSNLVNQQLDQQKED